jgi:hypothetical protein
VPGRDYEAAVAAVEARLHAIRTSRDPSAAVGAEADRELRRLKRARGGDPELRAAFAIGWLHWYRQLTVNNGQGGEDRRQARTELLPCYVRGLEPIPDEMFPGIAIAALHEAATLLQKAMTAHDFGAIMAAVSLWRRIQSAIPESAEEWPLATSALCTALQGSFECTGNIEDLDEAVNAGRSAVEAIPPADPRRGMLLGNAAAALRMRSDNSGGTGRQYLDEAIDLGRRAIAATPEGRGERSGMLSNLAVMLRARFEAYHAPADLAESVEFARGAVATGRDMSSMAHLMSCLRPSACWRTRWTGHLRGGRTALEPARTSRRRCGTGMRNRAPGEFLTR